MPLVRYEVRCEHSLANPELYRSAARDDPESLLEGVAMAGLVGIVRQLGDLAEFAAEIFCGLHDELMSLGSRGHDLNMRVQQLEDELPAIEKALLSEPNQLRFAYTNGADWHASIRSDQNHCTSGDLPRFVRNYYEECRGPPQLFLLDKFDVSGVGACLKRYTDPSFFKLEWASTELLRAQREQRDKKARRDKKKGRKRRTGQPIAAINQIPARVRYGSASLEDLEGLPYDIASAFNIEALGPSRLGPKREFETQRPRGLPRGPKDMLVEESSVPALRPIQLSAVSNISEGVKHSQIGVLGAESANDSKCIEPEDLAGSSVGRISRIIDLEDRAAAPATGYAKGLNNLANGRAQGSEAANGVVHKDSGAAAMPRSVRTPVGTPRANARGEFSMEGDKPPSGNVAGSPTLVKSASRTSLFMDALDTGRLSGKFLWKDGNEGGRFSRQISIARSGSEFDDFVDAPSRIGSEGDGAGSDFDSPGSVHRATHFNGDALNHVALKNHVEAQKAYVPSGMKLMEQQQPQPLPTPGKLADIVEREPDNGALPKDDLPAPLNEDPRSSSASSGARSNRSGELLKAFPGNGTCIQVVPVADICKKDGEPDLVLAKGPSSLDSSSGASSPTTQDVLKPSVSTFSRHSYSSELISVSSVSEPNSPTSPNSPSSPNAPAFHALYSPRGSPPRESAKSPPVASYSPGTQTSSQSSPSLEEAPVLSESPTSFARSPSILALSEPVSRQRLELYPLPTPPMSPERENSSNSRRSSGSITDRFGGSQNGDIGRSDVLHALPLSPTSKHDVVSPLVLPISPVSGPPRHSVFSESTRSSLQRAADSPPTSPYGSPKKSFQRIFLSSPSLSGSPLMNSSDDAPRCRSLGDEDSAPSSPSGSVIIKDSPPESPRSSYTGSECESRDFDAIQGRLVMFATKESSGLKHEAYADEVVSVASLGSKSVTRTSPEQGKSLLLSPVSHSEVALETSAKFSLDSSMSNGSADHSVSQQSILPSVQSPPLRPEVDPLPSTADHSVSQERISLSSQSPSLRPEVEPLPSTLKPISTARSTTKSYKSMTSNSPPDSPVASSNLRRGKAVPPSTPPRAAFKLPHYPPMRSPMRSPLRSPMLTPRSYFSETGTLKWLGRLDPGLSPKPNFSLPPNLVNHSETSSPECSPPPQLDLDSPSKSIAASEDLDSPQTMIVHKGVEVEEYRLLDDPPVATSYVDAGDLSEEDCDDEDVRHSGPQRAELSAASNSGPSHSSSSSEAGEFHVRTRVAEFEQLAVPKQPITWASVVASGRAEQSGLVSKSPEDEAPPKPGLILRIRADDAEVQSPDSKHGSPSLVEESESSVELEHAAARDEVSERFNEGDVCATVGAHASEKSLLDNEERTVPLEPVNDAVDAAPVIERAEPSLNLEADDVSVADHISEKASPPPLENGDRSLASFEPLNVADFDGAAPANVKSPVVSSEEAEHVMDLEPADVDAGAEESLPLPESLEADMSRSSAAPEGTMNSSATVAAAQSHEEGVPSLPTRKPDNCHESTADVAAVVHSVETTTPSPSPVPEFELRSTPTTKDALEAAIAQHDRNMLKVLTHQEPASRPPPPPDERSVFIDQMRTSSFNLRRNEGVETAPSIPRPVANINVAAILEKANAIRQAFAGSDDDDDGEDDWSDS